MKTLTSLKRRALAACAAALLAVAAGCTTPAKPTGMAATNVAGLGAPFPGTVAVEAGRRDYEKKAAMAQIGDSELRAAIQASLESSGLFQQVVSFGESDYLVYAAVGSIKQPVFGMSMTVSLTADWKLMDAKTNETIWSDRISSEYTARASEAVVGATRLRVATEGAARENIEKALAAIAALPR